MTDRNHTPNVGDCDVHALVGAGFPAAVLAYAPGRPADSDGIESDYAVMPQADAVRDGLQVVARAAEVLARFGPAPLEDDQAHDAADAINAASGDGYRLERCGIEGCRGLFLPVPGREFTNAAQGLRVVPTRCDLCGQDSARFLPVGR